MYIETIMMNKFWLIRETGVQVWWYTLLVSLRKRLALKTLARDCAKQPNVLWARYPVITKMMHWAFQITSDHPISRSTYLQNSFGPVQIVKIGAQPSQGWIHFLSIMQDHRRTTHWEWIWVDWNHTTIFCDHVSTRQQEKNLEYLENSIYL